MTQGLKMPHRSGDWLKPPTQTGCYGAIYACQNHPACWSDLMLTATPGRTRRMNRAMPERPVSGVDPTGVQM